MNHVTIVGDSFIHTVCLFFFLLELYSLDAQFENVSPSTQDVCFSEFGG